ncbi:MAG: efflux RND transporter periplasmic adaptor subunit [Gemmatimonadota bacterium]
MKKRHAVGALGGLVLLFLAWQVVQLVRGSLQGPAARPPRPPVAVQVDTVRWQPIREIRELTGTVHPLYQYVVAPKVSGRVVEIRARIGDWVERGQLIARIDDAEYQQDVLEAEANLRIAQANLAEAGSQLGLAEQELARVQSLQEKGISSPSELDAATTSSAALKSRLSLARAQVEQRQAALSSARIRLSYTVLRTTEPGFVGERFVDEGSLLAPNALVVSVMGIDTVIVRTTVIERVYGLVRLGQTAVVTVDAFPSQSFEGRVARLAPMLQEASRVAQMEVEVANPTRLLKPGMFSKVQVVLAEKDEAQVVPSPALVNRHGVRGLFAVRPGEAEARFVPVQVGIEAGEHAEITAPRIDGVVVTLGQHLLEDGSPVLLPGT